MNRRALDPRRIIHALLFAGAVAATSAGCAQIFGIDGPVVVSASSDAALDGTPSAADADAASEDGRTSADASGADACAAILARMLGGSLQPPNEWAGIDVSSGGAFTNVPGSGGATLGQAGAAGCASYTEPTLLPPGQMPFQGGYREVLFGDVADPSAFASAPINFAVNMQSGGISQIILGSGYTGTVSFHSRDQSHAYEIGMGFVHRDGAEYPPDFATGDCCGTGDGGTTRSAWANELYDGLMATFSPDTPPLTTDCATSDFIGYWNSSIRDHATYCVVSSAGTSSLFGVRPLDIYFDFEGSPSGPAYIYGFWWGSVASCATPIANAERMDDAPIVQSSLGGLHQGDYGSNPHGLTVTEANEIECNGALAVAPDPGYGAMTWGQSDEVLLEYDLDSGVNYRLFARSGYAGTFYGGFTAGIDIPLELDGGDYVIDWFDGGAMSSALPLSNAFCGAQDGDCVDAGDCTLLPDDGQGHSYLGLRCGTGIDMVGFTFPLGSSAPSQIFTTNMSVTPP